MRWVTVILAGFLFMFNSDICDMYYDANTQTAQWWELRFKFYSTIFLLLGLSVFLNGSRKIKIITIPVLAIFLGDWKDRVIFNYTERHWSDLVLVILAVLLVLIIWRNGKPRSGSLESNN